MKTMNYEAPELISLVIKPKARLLDGSVNPVAGPDQVSGWGVDANSEDAEEW